jgi:hypothetical protein
MLVYSISIIQRYILFITGLLFSTILPSSWRGIYLWYGTFVAIVISLYREQLTNRLLLTALSGLAHSAIHLIWPFLDDKRGYNPNVSAFPDVFFHSLMIIFVWINIRNKINNISLQIITYLCILGTLLNCVFTNFKTSNNNYYYLFLNNPYYLVFNLTTSFQAVSTAYWIAFSLHYGEWEKKSFVYGLFLCNLVIVSNWFWYNCDDIFELGIGLIKMSMKYRYIEGLFIVSTWIPLLFSNTCKISKIN